MGDNLLRIRHGHSVSTRTALDKLTIGVDSVSTAGLETQIEAVRGGEQVQMGEFTSFWTLSMGTCPKKYHSDQC
jgi:hypothetical protein